MDLVSQAIVIAQKDLRSCYGGSGIYAGLHHFKDYWARDSFFASLGSLAIYDNETVKKNLELFLDNISKEGQLPLRIGKSSFGVALSFVTGFQGTRRPIYTIDKSNSRPTDQNSLFIICLYEYMKKTGDHGFFRRALQKAEKIMHWNFMNDRDNDLLIEEDMFCNWADSVKKRGKVLYTNVCHCHALYCMSMLTAEIDKEKSRRYKKLHDTVKAKINEIFWSGEHYLDWIDGEKTNNYFSTDGNMLAVIWDIADLAKARHIEECAHIFGINKCPSAAAHPIYPDRLIAPEIKLIGISEYHSSFTWIWLGAVSAIAASKAKNYKEAAKLIEKMAQTICEFGSVFEIYDSSGEPVKTRLYKSERPLAWSAGMFLYADSIVKSAK